MNKITEKKLLQRIEDLEKEVQKYKYDFLTSMKLRLDFNDELYNLYDSENDFYLIMIDVNGLHKLNREEGYLAGDNLIKRVSRIIKKYFGSCSYRTGGDEFIAIDTEINMCHREFFKEIIKFCTLSIVKKTSICISPEMLIDKADKIMIEYKRKIYNNESTR